MKIFNLILSLIGAILFSSCSPKTEVENIILEFFSALKNENIQRINELYPNFSNLPSYYKSDTVIIKDIERLENNEYQVSVISKFTNELGKSLTPQIKIFVKPLKSDQAKEGYIIYDTKGLSSFRGEGLYSSIYSFAKRKGYLHEANLSDQEIVEKLKIAAKKFSDESKRFIDYLTKNVIVDSWNWDIDKYTNYASGRGVVKNNTPYSINSLKYIITFYDKNDEEITKDTGHIIMLDPYGFESFSFMTSQVGSASKAQINLYFEPEFVTDIVAKYDFD